MADLTALVYPRHVHKADKAYLRVDTPEACDEALADGWLLLPPLSDAELAQRRAFRLAAGEPDEDGAPADPVVPTPDAPKGRGKGKRKGKKSAVVSINPLDSE